MPFVAPDDTGDGMLQMTCIICMGTRFVSIYCMSCFRRQSKHPEDCPRPYMHPCCLACFEMLASRKERAGIMLDAGADTGQAAVSG